MNIIYYNKSPPGVIMRGNFSFRLIFSLLIILMIGFNSISVNSNLSTDKAQTRQSNQIAPMFRGGPERLGVYETKSPDYGILIWNYTTGNQVQSSAILYENRIYFGSDDGNIYCLNAESGKKLWNYTAQNLVQSTPCIFEGRLYIGASDFGVYCLDAITGEFIWKFKANGPIVSSPLVVNNTVVVGSFDNYIYAINALNGSLKWKYETGFEIWASPAYADESIYIGSLDGYFYSLWLENGTERWNFTTITDRWEKGIYSTCAILGDKLFFGSEDYNVYGLNITNGDMIWYYETEGYVYSSPSINDGVLFIAGLGLRPNGELSAIPIVDPNGNGIIEPGEVIWIERINDIDGGSSPIVVDGKVIVGSNEGDVGDDGKVYCFDEVTGVERWNFTIAGDIHSSPLASFNKIFIGSLDNNMYCIGSTDNPLMVIQSHHSLEGNTLEAGKTIDIVFTAISEGRPVGSAWFNFGTTGGELSATYGTALADGVFKISFTAPLVTQNTTVTISAKAVKVGYENGTHEFDLFIEPLKKGDSEKSDIEEFIEGLFEQRNQGYCLVLIILVVINIIIFVLIIRKRRKNSDDNKK